MNACVLTIGDELLQGFTTDTNSSWLGLTLLPYDINISKKITVGDDINSIVEESRKILDANFDYFFITGGLGPTHDDITKEAVCQLLNDELIFEEVYYSQLKEKFDRRLVKMPESNRSQAMLLKRADSIPNDSGSALGMHILEKRTHIFILPGVPQEMKEMVSSYIIPNYIGTEPKENYITIKTAGVMESRLAEMVKELMKKYSNSYRFAFLPHYNGVSFRIRKSGEKNDIQKVKHEFIQVMQPYAYGLNDDSLTGVLGEKLQNKKLTIAVAESCTGGLIGKRLTDVAGSSEYFLGSITAYSNQLKTTLLNVSDETLIKHGAVSEKTALEMAMGIKNKTGSDIGLSTTGISGPGGGTETKLVGLVYIGLDTPEKSIVKKYNFPFGRHIHREMTTTAALNITRLSLEN